MSEQNIIKKLRNRILEVALRDSMGHIPSALSILDVIWVLYNSVMTPDDVFILSKGHGVMALYAVLEEKGLMSWNEKLMGHPKRGGAITASTGSLGHGLPMAVGMALAKKIKGEKGRVFCLIGDGECNEGSIWESALLACEHKLDNLTVIVDDNESSNRALNMGIITDKFKAFGWNGQYVNGHWYEEMEKFFVLGSNIGKPMMFNAHTKKGNGVKFMEGDNSWHNRRLTKEEYEKAI
jgi:transketolase